MTHNRMVYVAGPLETGDLMANVTAALDLGTRLLLDGFVPIVPHLTAYWNMVTPVHRDEWLEYDHECIKRCDCLFRMEGESHGGDEEVQFAYSIGVPVFFDLEEMYEWAQKGMDE